MMHGHEKSDPAIVAVKLANKIANSPVAHCAGEPAVAEPVEPRAGTKGNAGQQSTYRTQSRVNVSQALERIRQVARERKKERFTALFHHICTDLLEEAFFELKEDAAPGVDRLTWKDYEADHVRNLGDLHDRVHRGAYRTGDRRIIRLIQKWLKAGVMEGGGVTVSDRGTGQGSVISPLLPNIYLHYALDLWALRCRRREARGDMIFVRYAVDFIVGFQHESDARRFLDEMRERLREFALSLHPEKTRLIEFGRFAAERRKRRELGKPETFNFLGFTSICGKPRAGQFQLKRKTRRARMRAKLKMIKKELWRRMHQPIPDQGKWLGRVVGGYFNYHAVPTNARALDVFRHHVTHLWRRMLRRRSQKDRITWTRMTELADAWLPKPIILHPWPSVRFAVTHPRWEPYAGKPQVRFCAGGAR